MKRTRFFPALASACLLAVLAAVPALKAGAAEAPATPEAPAAPGDAAGIKTITSGPGEVTELWTGKVLTATFRAGMCFGADGKARGVLILRHANGQEDTYHLYGGIRANAFELTHSSGHSFTGRLTGPRSMEGRVKLKNGLSLSLEGERTPDVPLVAEDCAPLPR